jgi:DNA invertase Pin-like site-specific DNA recombinase
VGLSRRRRYGRQTVQRDKLSAAGCDPIREEKVSGTSMNGRTELEAILAFIRPGDALVVTRIDRPARNIGDLPGHSSQARGQGR